MKFLLKTLLCTSLPVLFTCYSVTAQITSVSGTIYDKETKETVPFATVKFKDSKISAPSDIDGKYKLESYYATDSIWVSAIGYATQTIPIKKDKTQVIDIFLVEASDTLEGVTITPPDIDPAIAIFKKIIRYKKVNNKEKLESYQYEAYNKVEFDMNNFSDKFIKRKILKPIKFIFDNIDSASGEKPYLPMFITESISDFFFRKNPSAHREYIKGTKVSGVENSSISQFLGDMYQNINLYDNYLDVFGRNFISPISDRGLLTYDYILMDSAWIGNTWCYQIKFKPKRRQEPTFKGTFWVNDTTYAIRKVECNLASDANINFIETFSFKQEFQQVQKEMWMLTDDYLLVDFQLTDKQMGFYGRKTSSYKYFVINEPKEDGFYSGVQNVIVNDDANDKDDAWWLKNRHDTLSQQEKMIYLIMDTITDIPKVKSFIQIVSMLISGYKVIGKFEYGPYFTTYSFNPYEGARFRVGGRTSNDFSRRLEFNGYLAYGLTDKAFKYNVGFRTMLTKKPRQLLSGYYKHDVEMLGTSSNAFRQDNLLASVFRRTPPDKMTMIDEYKLSYEYEYFQGLNNQLHLRHRTITPVGKYRYEKLNSDASLDTVNNIRVAEITYYLRFAYNEKYVAGEFDRTSMGTTYPVFDVQYTLGLSGVFNSDYGFHRVVSSVTQWFNVGAIGWFKYRIEGGKFFGTLPYPILELHRGNNTYYYDEMAFNLMNLYEFVSDQYVSAYGVHHFQGFFLNHIPLLRRLKWREVASFKAVYGSVTDPNRNELLFPSNLHTLNVPYMEVSVGIENILKVLRVDYVQRLTYLNHPGIAKWGIRAKIEVDF
ncbi:MAG: DUF5686 family protein [Flavobacteriales bacterium]